MRYADTSVIVAALTPEHETVTALAWLDRMSEEGVVVSDWVTAEVASALSRKLRTGRLDDAGHGSALVAYRQLLAIGAIGKLAIESRHFELAATLTSNWTSGLRAADALHLAVADSNAIPLCTYDRRMAEGAESLGLAVELLG
jgi:uncharacterized protein